MKANKQTGLHLDQLLSQTVLKGEGQHNRAAGYKAKQKHTQKKKYSQPSVKEPLSCLGYAFEEVVGFPLASSRADVLALWPTEEPCGAPRRESWYFFFFFFLKALILHSGSESHPSLRRQFRRGGRKKFLATGEGRGGSNSLLLCVVQTVEAEKTSVSYCTVGRKSRARRVTGSLMAAESCYMGVEAVFCCVAQC